MVGCSASTPFGNLSRWFCYSIVDPLVNQPQFSTMRVFPPKVVIPHSHPHIRKKGFINQGSLNDPFCPFETWLFPPK